jgi:outer membrane PBP1 activator LpoA protein
MSRAKSALVCTPLLAALLLAGCGDDDDTTTPVGTETVATADVERYCELSKELDAAGEEQFEALEQDPNATNEDFEEAEADLVESNEAQLEEIQQVAPPEIAADVGVLVAGLRARAGLEEGGPSEREQNQAEIRIDAFENDNCG